MCMAHGTCFSGLPGLLAKSPSRIIRALPRRLLRHVRSTIRSSNREAAIEHTQYKDETIRLVASQILPVSPNERAARVRSRCLAGHDSDDNDSYDKSTNYQAHEYVVNYRQKLVAEEQNQAAKPDNNEVADEDVPVLWLKAVVGDGIEFEDAFCANCC